ncbi:MAG: 4-hydroxy-3-methylbut-2-enyl diphosphate reductase [Blastocatellia bacterium]
MEAIKASKSVIRRGFGLKEEVRHLLIEDFYSELVSRVKSQKGILKVGRLNFRLAEEFGFCYGVDFALNLVYETRRKFHDRRILLMSEILHNPKVNLQLRQMGIEFLDSSPGKPDRFSRITADDIVVVPAFGATLSEYEQLQDKGCLVVDTTCGSVVAVWKRVERYAQDGFTAIIHGKYDHEETRATSSRTFKYQGGKYLVVLNQDEAAYVCRYIVEGRDKQEFLRNFEKACSPGFDPDRDLRCIGLANQTTMLSNESVKIAEMFRDAIVRRYGSEAAADRFRHFDTICTATQERQDAVKKLAQEHIDLMIVIGGYNTSNTTHLCEISSLYKPTYHISDADCVISSTLIRHKPIGQQWETLVDNWLPNGEVGLGLTAGASTPGRSIGEVMERIVNCCFAGSSAYEVSE